VLVWIGLGLFGGLAAGWGLRVRGRALAGDAAVGTLGAVLGGFMASVLLGLDVSDLELTSIVVAALGAVLLIVILHSLPAQDVFD
jgi:uncharacterized membrane protein YeaQ/YmgE (transglycosylase-associated protein family)